tara:strand:- start:206 stop:358 length:153 start_codon:yes stop_codon:yes gene_type:complete
MEESPIGDLCLIGGQFHFFSRDGILEVEPGSARADDREEFLDENTEGKIL